MVEIGKMRSSQDSIGKPILKGETLARRMARGSAAKGAAPNEKVSLSTVVTISAEARTLCEAEKYAESGGG
jgi:hypothetical protein